MKVADYVTLLRLGITPLWAAGYLYGLQLGLSPLNWWLSLLLLMVLAEGSDILDGYLARWRKEVTGFGQLFDPMADTLFRLTLYFCLTQPPVNLSLIWPLLMLARELSMGMLRTMVALQGRILAARWSGKAKAIIQAMMSFIIILFWGKAILAGQGSETSEELQRLANGGAALATVISLTSFFEYLWSCRRQGILKRFFA